MVRCREGQEREGGDERGDQGAPGYECAPDEEEDKEDDGWFISACRCLTPPQNGGITLAVYVAHSIHRSRDALYT